MIKPSTPKYTIGDIVKHKKKRFYISGILPANPDEEERTYLLEDVYGKDIVPKLVIESDLRSCQSRLESTVLALTIIAFVLAALWLLFYDLIIHFFQRL